MKEHRPDQGVDLRLFHQRLAVVRPGVVPVFNELPSGAPRELRHIDCQFGIEDRRSAGEDISFVDRLLRKDPQAVRVRATGSHADDASSTDPFASAGSIDIDSRPASGFQQLRPSSSVGASGGRCEDDPCHQECSLAFTNPSRSPASWGPTVTFQPGRFSSNSPLIWAT